MINVMRRLAARYAVLLIVCCVVLSGFELIVPAAISALDMPALLGGVLAMLPPPIRATLGEQVFGGLSTGGLLAFGWNHPIAHTVGTAVAVVLGARAVAGEADNGTLELVVAQPITRHAYLAAHVAYAAVALAVLCSAGMLGTIAGTRLFGITNVSILGMSRVAANFFLLLGALYAVTLLASVFVREGGSALGSGFLVAVLSFLMHTVALLWPAAAFLMPYALHTYYVPRDVLFAGSIAPVSLAVLIGCAVACLIVAFWRFARRDIP